MSQQERGLNAATSLGAEGALFERVARVIVGLCSAAALLVTTVGDVADWRLIYVTIAIGLAVVVALQDLLPMGPLHRWRQVVEAAALVLYISVLVVLTGGQASPLGVAYLLPIAGAALWGGAWSPALVGGASSVAYAVVALGPRLLATETIDGASGAHVATNVVALLLVAMVASAVGWQRRRRRRGLATGEAAETRTPIAEPPLDSAPQDRVPSVDVTRHVTVIGGRAPWDGGTPSEDRQQRPTLLRAPALAPAEALDLSIRGLLRRTPEMSAYRTLSTRQAIFLLALASLFVGALAIAPVTAIVTLNGVITAVYLLALAFNLGIFRALLRQPPMVKVSDADARAVADDQLPSYTVLVAAYRESEIIEGTIRALEQLDYPRDRLEILLLLEAEDRATLRAAVAAQPAPYIRIVAVPNSPPKTKPKACNYGLLLSSGELVTIFDAEDRPDPLQLRRAAVALARLPRDVACLQALLQFHNERQNVLTRWFSAEYVTWFAAVLPAIVRLGAPVPLGGTSMHIRREVLEKVGGWDPFNVTEDADLGIRLARFGYRTLVLDSVTFEEANSDFINWVKQRSRWYKGYLQTWLVHLRQPRRLWRELGPTGVLGFSVLVGTTPLLALLNPFFWLLTAVWFTTESPTVQTLFPWWIFYPALVSVVFGNFLALYRTMVAVRLADRPALVLWVLLVPFYWLFMSIAALRAFVQLLIAPSLWEKTLHGLDRPTDVRTVGSPQA